MSCKCRVLGSLSNWTEKFINSKLSKSYNRFTITNMLIIIDWFLHTDKSMRFLIYVCVEKTDTVCTFFQRTHCKFQSAEISFIAMYIFFAFRTDNAWIPIWIYQY